jgi:hypothetical protein
MAQFTPPLNPDLIDNSDSNVQQTKRPSAGIGEGRSRSCFCDQIWAEKITR